MDMQSLIAVRRDGRRHSADELRQLARAAADPSTPDYQLSAWLMAAYLNPLDEDETAALTVAMAESGQRVDMTGLPKPWLDKHSTGGVGDKTTLVLLPLLAACGLTVVKMSGRGLGITGGTVDKLASIPGFRLDLSPAEMKAQASQIGLALTGQTPDLAPADKRLYALRDATATVSSMPLIVSSILSKKLAGGADSIVLDVKCGSGAFMPSLEAARELAEMLAATARRCGLRTRIAVTDMDQPLGAAVGNALEVAEALSVLDGGTPSGSTKRFRELCLTFAAEALAITQMTGSRDEGLRRAEEALASGAARAKAGQWIEAQGGPKDVPGVLPTAPVRRDVSATSSGWLERVDARTVGEVSLELGGGRKRKEDEIDPSVGIWLHVQVGVRVEQGDRLATVHAASEADAEAACRRIGEAFRVSPEPIEQPTLFLAWF